MLRKKEKVHAELLGRLRSGGFSGGRLPPERELALDLGVSQGTLRVALGRLAAAGLIERIPSLGTFVRGERAKAGRILNITHSGKNIDNPFLYSYAGILSAAERHHCEVVPIAYEQVASMSAEVFAQSFPESDFIGAILSITHILLKGDAPWRLVRYPLVAPHVYHDEAVPEGVARVTTNTRACWRMAVQHLLDCGHRRIGVLTTSQLPHLRKMEVSEYQRLLSTHGADPDPALLGRCRYDPDEIAVTVQALLDLPVPPTALLCFSDFFAMHAYPVIKARGYRIPEDMAVMGTCGYPGGEFFDPPLSTVSYNYFACGVASVELLLDAERWRVPGCPAPVVQVPGSLIARASTRCRLVHPSGLVPVVSHQVV